MSPYRPPTVKRVLANLRAVQKAGLQAISIDFADPGNRAGTRQLASQIMGPGHYAVS